MIGPYFITIYSENIFGNVLDEIDVSVDVNRIKINKTSACSIIIANSLEKLQLFVRDEQIHSRQQDTSERSNADGLWYSAREQLNYISGMSSQ